MPSIHLVHTPEEIASCFPVMHQLRPYLKAEEFVSRVQTMLAEGYRLAAMQHEGSVVAVSGFRLMHMLGTGLTLYVDDLVTDEGHRSRGFGKVFLDWLEAYARRMGCETLALDSGTHRKDAHAFYLRERLRITDFHFEKKLR